MHGSAEGASAASATAGCCVLAWAFALALTSNLMSFLCAAALENEACDLAVYEDKSSDDKFPKPNDHDVVAPQPKADRPIVIKNEKDLSKLVGKISALPSQPKEIAKVYKRISKLDLQPGEKLCMVDSGSFIHAIDAENDLPDH